MYVRAAEAAKILGVSVATITRCKQAGAPVHYLGTCGRIYEIDPVAFGEWMHEQGMKANEQQPKRWASVADLRAARHRAV